ncbi:hypothetical protein T439DRAFT_324040 [Meredithblackwellia eburnea MCA 4105]
MSHQTAYEKDDLEDKTVADSGPPSVKGAEGQRPQESTSFQWVSKDLWRRGTGSGVIVESRGIVPLTPEERTETRFIQNFTLWLTMNMTINAFSAGTLGPLYYGLSLRNSALIIVFSNLLSCAVPSYLALFGPRLGMRMMTNARYSYGYFGAMLPIVFNLMTFIGFCAVNSIVGGQTLAAVNPGHLSVAVGIVIIAVVSLAISFCGYRILHTIERWAWIPILISFILLAAFGGRHLGAALQFEAAPATAGSVLTFISIIIGFTISYSGMSADLNTYMRQDVGSATVFFLTLSGLYLPCALLQILGAAFGCAALSGQVTTWSDAFGEGAIGPLMAVALEPLRGFGKVILVILALGIITNNAPTVYAFSMSAQTCLPFLAYVPRFLIPVAATAIYLPIALVGANHFFDALSSFLGIIGYWASIFAVVFLIEHFVFRKGKFTNYDVSHWNQPSKLPVGLAAIFASICGAALSVVSMDQVWYRGPIAKKIAGPGEDYGGDVGIELGAAVAGIVYLFARSVEKRVFQR